MLDLFHYYTVFSAGWNVGLGLQADGFPPAARTMLSVIVVIVTHSHTHPHTHTHTRARVNSSEDNAHYCGNVNDVVSAATVM